MSASSTSIGAFSFEQRLFDLALQNPGMKFKAKSSGQAINIISRCNRLRKLLREAEQKRLDALISGEVANTIYDKFIIKQRNEEGKYDRDGCIVLFDLAAYDDFQIVDAEGNPIELKEPDENEVTKIVNSPEFLSKDDIVG